METIVDRIRDLCRKNGTSITKIEMELGYANGTIGKWAKGKKPPPLEKVIDIAEKLNTSVKFLQTGEEQQESSNVDVKLPEKYYKLSEENRQAIDKMILFFYEQQGKG